MWFYIHLQQKRLKIILSSFRLADRKYGFDRLTFRDENSALLWLSAQSFSNTLKPNMML